MRIIFVGYFLNALYMRKLIWIAISTLSFSFAQGQNRDGVEDFLNTYVDDNTGPYLQPLFDLFTSNLNSGTREWSSIDSSLYIRLGMIVMNSYPTNSQKTFTAKTGENFEPFQTAKAPTIIGNINPVEVEGINGTSYIFPGGYNLKSLPLAVPQITIGGIMNTELSGRYFSFDLDNNFGKLSYFGIGFRHSLNPYITQFGYDISVGYYFQNFKDDPYIDIKNHLATAHLGKSGRNWSAQLILGYQQATTDIKYTYLQNDELKTKELKLTNKNHFIGELSGALKLSIIKLHAAINYSGPLTIAAGLCIEI